MAAAPSLCSCKTNQMQNDCEINEFFSSKIPPRQTHRAARQCSKLFFDSTYPILLLQLQEEILPKVLVGHL